MYILSPLATCDGVVVEIYKYIYIYNYELCIFMLPRDRSAEFDHNVTFFAGQLPENMNCPRQTLRRFVGGHLLLWLF